MGYTRQGGVAKENTNTCLLDSGMLLPVIGSPLSSNFNSLWPNSLFIIGF